MENQLLQAVQIVEKQLDAEIDRLDNLDDDELDLIRKKRLESMKNSQKQKIEWQQNGHGSYSELADEREFFDACKKSQHVVCHFYRDSTFRCKIVDKHLEQLARQHIECKFIKINAEKVHFLIERLKVKIMPTIALIKENKPIDYIVGFTDLGNTDDFDTEMLEWRIARAGIIEYNGDLINPPQNSKKKHIHTKSKSIIKGNEENSDDDSNDW
ncbi:thioredoxin domain-containing 9 [Brachionus plicatilis]|uniref:Thioredoxin domain-containing protein 9 n=1 Tax=Brachionus plicatilis TaxID=10195 RepID=A0A3M7QY67_BRAPC|nr:thioredoxin domain-containing 9 [Brachionus plicatilis]